LGVRLAASGRFQNRPPFERVCSVPWRFIVCPVVSLVRVEAVVGVFLLFSAPPRVGRESSVTQRAVRPSRPARPLLGLSPAPWPPSVGSTAAPLSNGSVPSRGDSSSALWCHWLGWKRWWVDSCSFLHLPVLAVSRRYPKELRDRAFRLAHYSAVLQPHGRPLDILLARPSRAIRTHLPIPLLRLHRKESLMVSGFRFPPLTSPSPAVLAFGRPRGGAWLIAHCPRPVPPWCVRPSRLARSFEIELWDGR
jgi:hypothetical protein